MNKLLNSPRGFFLLPLLAFVVSVGIVGHQYYRSWNAKRELRATFKQYKVELTRYHDLSKSLESKKTDPAKPAPSKEKQTTSKPASI